MSTGPRSTMRTRAAEPGITIDVSSHHGAYRTATATRERLVGFGGMQCHRRESMISTDPAAPVARISLGWGAIGPPGMTPATVGLVDA